MTNQRFYLISENPVKAVGEIISEIGIITNTLVDGNDLQSIEFFDYWQANKVIQELKRVSGAIGYNYIVLNEIGYKEFVELRDEQNQMKN